MRESLAAPPGQRLGSTTGLPGPHHVPGRVLVAVEHHAPGGTPVSAHAHALGPTRPTAPPVLAGGVRRGGPGRGREGGEGPAPQPAALRRFLGGGEGRTRWATRRACRERLSSGRTSHRAVGWGPARRCRRPGWGCWATSTRAGSRRVRPG